MTAWRNACVVALLVALLSTSGPARAVTISPGVQVGTVTQLSEISGLVVSRSMANTLWVHNDSGDSARFFAINVSGSLLGAFSLTGGTATDWEDIAIAPKPGGGNYLYLGDIGDNSANRTGGVSVYRVTEPTSASSASISAANYTKVTLKYPDNTPRNAESLIVDPLSGDLYVISKGATGRVYRAPNTIFNTPSTTAVLSYLGDVNASLPNATAADVSPDGKYILVRNIFNTAYLFTRGPAQSIADALHGAGVAVPLQAETQGEAIGWAANGSGFYTTSEQSIAGPRPIWYYAVTVPEPATAWLAAAAAVACLIARRTRRSA